MNEDADSGSGSEPTTGTESESTESESTEPDAEPRTDDATLEDDGSESDGGAGEIDGTDAAVDGTDAAVDGTDAAVDGTDAESNGDDGNDWESSEASRDRSRERDVQSSAEERLRPEETASTTEPDGSTADGDTTDIAETDTGGTHTAGTDTATTDDDSSMPGVPDPDTLETANDVPEDVQKYARFSKMDGAQYDRVNEFLRDRTYITAREWAIARLCSDFRTETGVEMTKIGENLPELVPFMTDTYTPQAVNQARSSFEDKVRTAGATFLYGAMCDFFTAEELDDVMYEATEVAKFLLEVEGVDLAVEDELEAEERISSVMREVREASKQLRDEDVE